ncbi:MAG: type II secretion system GspH family protein [Acetobacterium sp.]|nr:type II secretion system GspH family protein [Bacillota bacterium]MCG2731268.1 type II secretion system GspH family protein [Acetobacterium sp.]
MIKILKNHAGVTIIETVAATAIVAIILITILGALLYGQKMVVFSDSKNNEAAQAQEVIDAIMTQLSTRTGLQDPTVNGVTKVNGSFFVPTQTTDPRKQYYFEPVDIKGDVVNDEKAVGYQIYVRMYYNNDTSYIDLSSFAKKGSVWL